MKDNRSLWLVGYGGIANSICQHPKFKGVDWSIISTKSMSDSPYKTFQIDSSDEQQVKNFVKQQSPPDGIIITTGMLHENQHMPEKTLSQCSDAWLMKNIKANVLPSIHFAKAIHSSLKPSSALKMVCFSARVGSISDNRLGGWHSYRMSKAMLNMLIKNIAIEWQVKSPLSTIIGYHPGTVDTRLSKPFQAHIDSQKLFSPQVSSDYFYKVYEEMTPEKSGQVLDWQGKQIPA